MKVSTVFLLVVVLAFGVLSAMADKEEEQVQACIKDPKCKRESDLDLSLEQAQACLKDPKCKGRILAVHCKEAKCVAPMEKEARNRFAKYDQCVEKEWKKCKEPIWEPYQCLHAKCPYSANNFTKAQLIQCVDTECGSLFREAEKNNPAITKVKQCVFTKGEDIMRAYGTAVEKVNQCLSLQRTNCKGSNQEFNQCFSQSVTTNCKPFHRGYSAAYSKYSQCVYTDCNLMQEVKQCTHTKCKALIPREADSNFTMTKFIQCVDTKCGSIFREAEKNDPAITKVKQCMDTKCGSLFQEALQNVTASRKVEQCITTNCEALIGSEKNDPFPVFWNRHHYLVFCFLPKEIK